MKKANNYFSKDLQRLLSDIREVGVGNVISDSVRGFCKWSFDPEMVTAYALDYLLAQVVENSGYCNRLYLWQCYVKTFRKFYGTKE